MKSDEARIAEAVASLTARLDTWHVEDAATKAATYVHDMLRAGWRPRALPVDPPPTTSANRVPAEEAQVCWCPTFPARCRIHNQENP